MASYKVQVIGLRSLTRDLKAAGNGAQKEIRPILKKASEVVASEARKIAASKGLRQSGALIGSIKPRVSGSTGLVAAGARRRGYNYPGRYEFGDRERPFLRPALAAKSEEVAAEFEDGIDKLLRRHSL